MTAIPDRPSASLPPYWPGNVAALLAMVDELDRFFHGYDTLFDLTPRSRANRTGEEINSR